MLQRQGTITNPSTTNDPVMSRDHVIRDVRVKLCFSNVQVQEFAVPKSYHQPAHLDNQQFAFNFDLEKKVLEQAKNSLLSTEREHSVQVQYPYHLRDGVPEILVPDRVDTSSEMQPPTLGNNQVLTQSLREFEADNDPFEMVQLQSIDDMAELQSVLQPNATFIPTTSQPTPYPPMATVTIASHDAPLVDLSDHSEPPTDSNTSRERPRVTPRHHISTPRESNDVMPPVPKPRTRSVSPSRRDVNPSQPKPVVTTGVRVLPPIPSSSAPSLPSYSTVPATVPAAVMTAPTLPSYEVAISTQPAKPPLVPDNQYVLPDPSASLSSQEQEIVLQMVSMGFPQPRVARATKRLKDSAKVLDFMVLVGELEETNLYRGDSIETALLTCDNNPAEAKKYLEQVKSYKEFGFSEQKIHAAYKKANNDWNKILDILVGDA